MVFILIYAIWGTVSLYFLLLYSLQNQNHIRCMIPDSHERDT